MGNDETKHTAISASAPPDPPAAAKTMSRDLFFPTPIYYTDLADAAAINEVLKPLIYQWRRDDPSGEIRTNEPGSGGWHSRTSMHLNRDFDALTGAIFEFVHGVFTSQGYDADFEPACDSMWANINPRLAANRDLKHRPAHTWHEVHYQPIEGRLVVFPAWLPHAVQPNMTRLVGAQGDRISVSFNFHQRRKPTDGDSPTHNVIVRADLET
jgi:hypothetical protein